MRYYLYQLSYKLGMGCSLFVEERILFFSLAEEKGGLVERGMNVGLGLRLRLMMVLVLELELELEDWLSVGFGLGP